MIELWFNRKDIYKIGKRKKEIAFSVKIRDVGKEKKLVLSPGERTSLVKSKNIANLLFFCKPSF